MASIRASSRLGTTTSNSRNTSIAPHARNVSKRRVARWASLRVKTSTADIRWSDIARVGGAKGLGAVAAGACSARGSLSLSGKAFSTLLSTPVNPDVEDTLLTDVTGPKPECLGSSPSAHPSAG